MKMHIRTAPLALAAAITLIGALPLAAQEVLPLAVRRAWLGFAYDEADGAVVVRDIVPDAPADRAGLRIGDRILRVDGEPATTEAITELGRTMDAGDTIRLRVQSGDREHSVEIVAEPRPTALVRLRPDGNVVALRADTLEHTIRAYLDSARLNMVRGPRILIERSDSIITMRVGDEPTVILRDSLDGRVRRFTVAGDSSRTWFELDDDPPSDSVLAVFRGRMDRARKRVDAVHWTLDSILSTPGDRPVAQVLLRRTTGLGQRAVAGAELSEMNDGLAAYFQVGEGLLVLRVMPGTPAARAGLEAGDVVVRAAGEPVRSIDDLRFAVAAHRENGPIELEIVRAGDRRTLGLEHEE